MKKFQAKRSAHSRKIRLSDGYVTRLVTRDDLIKICGYKKQHANRILSGKSKLPDHMRELLMIRIVGSIPEFPSGYYIHNGIISCPNGFEVTWQHLENFSFFMTIMGDMTRDIKRLTKRNNELEEKLKHRSEIRVYHNDEKQHRRVLKLVK